MRIQSVDIQNFRGVKRVALDDLHEYAAVTFAGPNGAGKTHILDAIALAFDSSRPSSTDLLGSWGKTGHIRLGLRLSAEEAARLQKFSPTAPIIFANTYDDGSCGGLLELTFTDVNSERAQTAFSLQLVQAWQSPVNDTPMVEYLRADRRPIFDNDASPRTELADPLNAQQFRLSTRSDAASRAEGMQLGGIISLFGTYHYLDLLDLRESGQMGARFSSVSEAFERVTGKKLLPPSSRTQPPVIDVEITDTFSHAPKFLSSGERQILAILYFLSRLGHAGGVLLLDEPELHLHARIHKQLLEELQKIGNVGQVVLASHSPRLAGSTGSAATVRVSRSGSTELLNSSLSESSARQELLDELGIEFGDFTLVDGVLLLEGLSDWTLLSTVFPGEFRNVMPVTKLFGKRGVTTAAELLGRSVVTLPWLAIVDKDFSVGVERDGVFRWRRRMIENELLQAGLLEAVFAQDSFDLSKELDRIKLEQEVQLEKFISTSAWSRLCSDACTVSIDPPANADATSRVLTRIAIENARSHQKSESLRSVVAETAKDIRESWEADWLAVADGKAIIDELVRLSRTNRHNLFGRFAVAMGDEPQLVPAVFTDLFQRMSARF